jgi:hypothetical protein
MLIAVDFDNTIVCYDALFHRVAREHGLIPDDLPANKNAVRDHLRATGREHRWTELQGEVYGKRMAEADPFPGVREFFVAARRAGMRLVIISHKTRHPCLGFPHDLHAAARGWLERQGFFASDGIGLRGNDVFFELTKDEKLARITACGATHCIDDLPEILTAPAFPTHVARILFDPQRVHAALASVEPAASWSTLHASLLTLPSLGLKPNGPPTVLAGGANNRVCRQSLADGRGVLVKRYAPIGDGRDRFATERAFYRHLAASGADAVPRALGWDEAARIGVFSWIDGMPPASVGSREVDAALRFVTALNRSRDLPTARELSAASEACFSLAAHASTVDHRVAALGELPGDEPVIVEARDFVCHELQPAWSELSRQLRAECGARAWERPLTDAERCVSPSDFGFHNALVTPEDRVVFFDFEYAGWDDPAKLVTDFFCQPDRAAPAEAFGDFVRALADVFPAHARATFAARCAWLLPVYQVKWACILLNEFTTAGRARREYSLGPGAAQARRPRQLDRARAMLARTRLAAA